MSDLLRYRRRVGAVDSGILPAAVVEGSAYFSIALYDGNGVGRAIGARLQPDMNWTKRLDPYGSEFNVADSLRSFDRTLIFSGYGENLRTTPGGGESNPYPFSGSQISQVYSSGYIVTAPTNQYDWDYCAIDNRYLAFNWVRSPAAGFDIVTYTGTGAPQSIAHNLGVAPDLIFLRGLLYSGPFTCYNSQLDTPGSQYLSFQSNGVATGLDHWNNVAATSTAFMVGSNSDVNSADEPYIAYVFAAKPGVSATGSYVGIGSSGLPVTTGFRPTMILITAPYGYGFGWYLLNRLSGGDRYLLLDRNFDEQVAPAGSAYLTFEADGFTVFNIPPNNLNASGIRYFYYAWA